MIFAFAEYELDTDQVELRVEGKPQALEPKSYSLLLLLLENSDRIIRKDEIAEKVWDGRFVSDTAVSTCLKSLRKALNDSGKSQRLVKTVHGQGVRFVGDVRLKSSSIIELDPRTITASNEARASAEEEILNKPSIAVLPFGFYSDVTEEASLANSVSYDIHVAISKLRWLMVISRGSTQRFRQSSQSHQHIGDLLGARYVLSGIVDGIGNRVSIAVELSDNSQQTVIWADRISENRENIHEVRDRIVSRVLSALEIEISLHEARRANLSSPQNLDAWTAYHLGVQHMYRFNKFDNGIAMQYLERSAELEPQFARAHSAISFVAYQDAFNRYTTDRDVNIVRARSSAERGMELEPSDPFTNFCLGRSHWLEDDISKSLPWLDRALELNPSFAQSYYSRSLGALMVGESWDVHRQSEIAVRLSPFDPFLYGFYGIRMFSCIESGDYADALMWAEKAANSPGALVVIDLMALAAATLANDPARADHWLQHAKVRKDDISQKYFFGALPFRNVVVRDRVSRALASHGL